MKKYCPCIHVNQGIFQLYNRSIGAWLAYTTVITVNVEMFALYIFSRNLCFLNIRENMYTLKCTSIIA